MSENVKSDNVVHPANALAAALSRAGRLLSTLNDLYDADQQIFVTGDAFIVHSVSTANELIDEAGRALVELHEKCDLSMALDLPRAEEDKIPESVAAAPPLSSAGDAKAKLSSSLSAAVATLQDLATSREPVAKSYTDFLNKITKAPIAGTPLPENVPPSVETKPLQSAHGKL
jgi:hypothetical protein